MPSALHHYAKDLSKSKSDKLLDRSQFRQTGILGLAPGKNTQISAGDSRQHKAIDCLRK